MAASSPSTAEQPLEPLPEALEDRCYDIWFGDDEAARESGFAKLRAEHPRHAAAIEYLHSRLQRSDSVLGGVLGEALDSGVASDQQWLALPAPFGDYEILEELGSGGFGAVYRARQKQPVQREVAIKVLHPGRQSERALARFSAERQALARMQHPAIAQVYDAGATGEGQPYIAMELVVGEPITEYCDRERLDIDERLRLFLAVCDGVTHAHQRSVLHRDLKPSNILVVERDGAPRPVIIDFGLAKALDFELSDAAAATLEGAFFGTPAYASPEQAAGDALDARSDVHALGLLLFELLAGDIAHGRDRMRRSSITEALRIVREEDPQPPSRSLRAAGNEIERIAANRRASPGAILRGMCGDLDGIVLRAIEREPDRRYPSVASLAEDVTRYLGNLPVTARRPTLVYVIGKLARRHRVAFALGALLVLAMLVGATAVVWGTIAVREARERTAQQQRRADWNDYAVSIASAKVALGQGIAQKAIEQLDATSSALRGWEYHLLRRQADDAARVLSVGAKVRGVQWLSEELLAVGFEWDDYEVWNVDSGSRVQSWEGDDGWLRYFLPLDAGRALVALGHGQRFHIDVLDLAGGRSVAQLTTAGEVHGLCVTSDGARFAVFDKDHVLQIGRVRGAPQPKRFEDVRLAIRSMAFMPDGERLLCGLEDGRVCILDPTRDLAVEELTAASGGPLQAVVHSIAVDASRQLAVAFDHHRFAVWNLASRELRFVSPTPAAARAVSIDPRTGLLFVAGGWGSGFVSAWNLATAERVPSFDGHRLGVHALGISPGGERLATGGDDKEVRIWDSRGVGDKQVVPLGLDCRDLDYDLASNRAAYCSFDGRLVVLDLATLEPIADVRVPPALGAETSTLFGDRMYRVDWAGTLRVFDVAKGEDIASTRLLPPGANANAMVAAPDGSAIAITAWERTAAVVVDTATLAVRWHHGAEGVPADPRGVWFSPDGREVFVSCYRGELCRFDAVSGGLLGEIHFDEWPSDVEFTADGAHLVVTAGEVVVLLTREGLREIRRFAGHNVFVASAAISPDGSRLATGGADGLVRIHDFATGTELVVFDSLVDGGHDLQWSADGRRLYCRAHSWEKPSHLVVWDAGPGYPAAK